MPGGQPGGSGHLGVRQSVRGRLSAGPQPEALNADRLRIDAAPAPEPVLRSAGTRRDRACRTFDEFIATKTGAGLSAKTIRNQLGLVSGMFKVAWRWRLVTHNPLEEVEAPRGDCSEMSMLTEAEVSRLLTAYRQFEGDPPEGDSRLEAVPGAAYREVALGAGLRRGELLALRWRDAGMLDGTLPSGRLTSAGRSRRPRAGSRRGRSDSAREVAAALSEQYEQSATGRRTTLCSATWR